MPEGKKESKGMQSLIRLINTFPLNILIGEGGIIYFLSLLRKGRKAIRENKITHLYSSYRPFTDHYAAYILKKRNPHLYWIADFRDLVIDPHYNHLYFPKIHQPFLKNIFKKADLLTTVSDGLAQHLKIYNTEVITLRNGIRDIPDQLIPGFSKYFRIAYTGSMFLDKRNAGPLFVALSQLASEKKVSIADMRIVYAGKDESYWIKMAEQHDLASILDSRGIVTFEDATLIQKNSCINILLTIASEQLQGVLTGKMIEYFQAGSPILTIVVNQNDPELDHALTDLEIGKSFSDQPHDLPGIKDFIYSEYMYWKKTGTNRKPVNLDILKKKYSVEATMRPLWDRLDFTSKTS